MEADHVCGFDYLVHINSENTKYTNKILFISFPFVMSYGWTMHHSTGMNRNIWAIRLILRPYLEHRVLGVCSHLKFDHKDALASSTVRYTSSQNSRIRLYKYFITAYVPAEHRQDRNYIFLVKYVYRLVHQFTKLTTQRLQVLWFRSATAYAGTKECVVNKEFWRHTPPVASACNPLNHSHIKMQI